MTTSSTLAPTLGGEDARVRREPSGSNPANPSRTQARKTINNHTNVHWRAVCGRVLVVNPTIIITAMRTAKLTRNRLAGYPDMRVLTVSHRYWLDRILHCEEAGAPRKPWRSMTIVAACRHGDRNTRRLAVGSSHRRLESRRAVYRLAAATTPRAAQSNPRCEGRPDRSSRR